MTAPAPVFLTRFNLPSRGVESLIRAHDGWLRSRVALFERYTLPSVARQSVPVGWLVYFDDQSPAWLQDRIRAWAETGILAPRFADEVDRDRLVADLTALRPHASEVITANLDNDDGLAGDFAERLAGAPMPHGGRAAIYLTRGLVLGPSGLFLRTDATNAFCAVREPLEGALTCWADWHNRLPRHFPVVEVPGQPAWLQVVHERNVSNRVRGRLVSPAPYAEAFGDLLAGVEAPLRARLMRDAVVDRPRRALRDGTRTGTRRAAVRVLGKERFDRLKLALARRTA